MKACVEGLLSKYTNVVKGWQYRWFMLNPETGFLDYFMVEGERRHSKPRGRVHLAGAVISPSEEDSQTFSVNSASGDIYKLRAADAKERQRWINQIRAVSERHTQAIANSNQPLTPLKARHSAQPPVSSGNYPSLAVLDAFGSVRQYLQKVNQQQHILIHAIESIPASGPVTCTDSEILLLKATSQATVSCLEQCLAILQFTQHPSKGSVPGNSLSDSIFSKDLFEVPLEHQERSLSSPLWSDANLGSSKKSLNTVGQSAFPSDGVIDPHDEVSDSDNSLEEEFESTEEHKGVILTLLSQLKLGMDLTRVVLPTFILEKRSLLEMFSDFMGHIDLFTRIPNESTPEKRMVAVLKWYLTSFHIGRHGSVAKKPYNPIIGEVFCCSWKMDTLDSGGDKTNYVRYFSEQVSHHPPVSAFYVEYPDHEMYLNAHVWTRSKFMGMSIGVNMIGEASLHLQNHKEVYTFAFPSAYARSIISTPWVELAGKVTINCPQSGYNSNIIFHSKPFYGGKLHHVTGEVKSPASPTNPGSVCCRVAGEWDSNFEFVFPDETSELITLRTLPLSQKRVRPVLKQHNNESRKLWFNVTEALKQGDVSTASEHKKYLEDIQRREEKARYEQSSQYIPVFFSKQQDTWIYNKMPC